jgi:hypothetical protein
MIEIEREERAEDGRWFWHVRGTDICGRSREPLLDACRAFKSMGEPTYREIGLFRPGRTDWDLRTTVGYGASKTVADGANQTPQLKKYQPFKAFGQRP